MVKANNKIAKCVLACGILVGVVSVGMGAMSKEEWDRNYADCIEVSLGTRIAESKSNKNACQALINNGLVSVEQCNKDSCWFVGGVYYAAGRYREAIPYFEKAIALGDNNGYFPLTAAYLVLQDYFNAKKYLEIACKQDKGDEEIKAFSCGALGGLYYEGTGVRQDYHKAHELYKKACDMKDGDACNNIGFLYDNGLGVRQNLSTAKQYYGKACDLGDQLGCDNYRKLNNQGVQ